MDVSDLAAGGPSGTRQDPQAEGAGPRRAAGVPRVHDPRTDDQRAFDLAAHLEGVHLYDFGEAACEADELYALHQLHDTLHRRRDFGLWRHYLKDHSRG